MTDIRELLSMVGDLVFWEALLKAKRAKYEEYIKFIRQYNMLELIVTESKGGCNRLSKGLEQNADIETATNLKTVEFLDEMRRRIKNKEIAQITAKPSQRSLEMDHSSTEAGNNAAIQPSYVEAAQTQILGQRRPRWLDQQTVANQQPTTSLEPSAARVHEWADKTSEVEEFIGHEISPERGQSNHKRKVVETTTVNVTFELITTSGSHQAGSLKTLSRRFEDPSCQRSFVFKQRKSTQASKKSKEGHAEFIKNLLIKQSAGNLADLFIPQTIYNIRNRQLQNQPQQVLLGHDKDHRYHIEEMDQPVDSTSSSSSSSSPIVDALVEPQAVPVKMDLVEEEKETQQQQHVSLVEEVNNSNLDAFDGLDYDDE